MTQAEPIATTLNEDKTLYVRILSIGNFVVAGFAFLVGCIPIIHIVVGISMALGMADEMQGDSLVPMSFGILFALFGSLAVLTAWAYAVLMILAGRALMERRKYMLCMVMAGISCMFAPIGTVVGVFTIVLLLDDDVRRAFGREVLPPGNNAEAEVALGELIGPLED